MEWRIDWLGLKRVDSRGGRYVSSTSPPVDRKGKRARRKPNHKGKGNVLFVFTEDQYKAAHRREKDKHPMNENWDIFHIKTLEEAKKIIEDYKGKNPINNVVFKSHGNYKGIALTPNRPKTSSGRTPQITEGMLSRYVEEFYKNNKITASSRKAMEDTYGSEVMTDMFSLLDIYSMMNVDACIIFTGCNAGGAAGNVTIGEDGQENGIARSSLLDNMSRAMLLHSGGKSDVSLVYNKNNFQIMVMKQHEIKIGYQLF